MVDVMLAALTPYAGAPPRRGLVLRVLPISGPGTRAPSGIFPWSFVDFKTTPDGIDRALFAALARRSARGLMMSP